MRSRLDRDERRHVRSLARYEVAVADGRATLAGHVRSRQVARSMVALAGGVRGVSSVEDRLVADEEPVVLVASAIGGTARNRGSRLVVRAEFGRVRIGGVYASAEARADALRVGAGVPGVVAVTGARPSDLIVRPAPAPTLCVNSDSPGGRDSSPAAGVSAPDDGKVTPGRGRPA